MKKIIDFFIKCVFLILCVSFPLCRVNADDTAYFSDEYEYIVRIYAGGQGTFSDGSNMILERVKAGENINVSDVLYGITMNPTVDAAGNQIDNKYYPKGIRESGRDNNTVAGTVFQITHDTDFVVAYAMEGGDTPYTVRYLLEGTDEELLPEETFYGNAGDKAVVAYRYIDGYVPQAYNLAMTLKTRTDNILTFYYRPGKNADCYYYETDGGVKYLYKDGENIVEHIPGKIIHIQGPSTAIINDTEQHESAVKVVEDNTPVNRQETEQTTEISKAADDFDGYSEEPKALIDLDDEIVAMAADANGFGNLLEDIGDNIAGKREITILIMGSCLIVLAFACVVLYVLKKHNKKDIEEKQNE